MYTNSSADADLKNFMIVVRRALLMIVAYIENKYNLKPHAITEIRENDD